MGKSRNNKEQDIFKRGNNNSELSNLKGLISPYGDDDDEENINDYCDDFTMPPSCGGPYPSCQNSCKIFDD